VIPFTGVRLAMAADTPENLEPLATYNIVYHDYDGTLVDMATQDPSYPTMFDSGTGLTLPTQAPTGRMPGYDWLGFWDCPLDPKATVEVPGLIPGSQETSLDFTIGNKITDIAAGTNHDVNLYLRYTSDMVMQDINSSEYYLVGAPGVFPNGSTAIFHPWAPGTIEYEQVLAEIDNQDFTDLRIVEIVIINAQSHFIQPVTFFGDALVGFKIPDDFSADDSVLIRVVFNYPDITLLSSILVDPTTGTMFIQGSTDHFSPFALLDFSDDPPDDPNGPDGPDEPDPAKPEIPQTGDNSGQSILLALWILLAGSIVTIQGLRRIKSSFLHNR